MTDFSDMTDQELTAELMSLYWMNHILHNYTLPDMERVIELHNEMDNRPGIEISDLVAWYDATKLN